MVVIFFCDEIVEARLRLEERGIQRYLGSIVRMQVKLTISLERIPRSERISRRKGESAETRGKQRYGGSLAAPYEKVAPALVNRAKINRAKIGRENFDGTAFFRYPTQSGAPWIITCGKLTSAPDTVKVPQMKSRR